VGLGVLLAAVVAAPAKAIEPPAGAIKNVELLANLPEAKDATAGQHDATARRARLGARAAADRHRHRDLRHTVAYPQRPVDLFRADGVTAYSHDVQVDADGIAWVSGNGGTRGYRTSGWAYDPLQGSRRLATPLDPIPYAGGGFPDETVGPTAGGFMHNAWRPVGRDAPSGDRRYRKGELLLATEEDFGPGADACKDRGQFTIASLEGSYDGEAWRSTPARPFRLKRVGNWNPFGKESAPPQPLSFCSAHYFDVDGPLVTYAWYGQGTRFLDISDPANPVQIAYYRPDDGNV
jgi:hypothetical protein